MGLRAKVFLVVGSAILVLFSAIFWFISTRLEREFLGAQKDDASTQIRIVGGIIDRDTQSFERKAIDWSHWDDTYDFIQTRDEAFVQSNLNDESLAALGVDFMFFVDKNGEVVFEKQVLTGEAGTSIPESLKKFLLEDARFQSLQAIFSGIVAYDQQPVLLTVQPILTSNGIGDPKGRLYFGHYLGQSYFDDIGALSHIQVNLDPYNDQTVSQGFSALAQAAFKNGEEEYIEINHQDDQVMGAHLLYDSAGFASFILKIKYEGSIVVRGNESLTLFWKAGVLLSLSFVGLIFLLSYWLVLGKIFRLKREVQRIADEKNAGERLVVGGKDEFASLASDINAMLDTLQALIERTERSESRFEVVANLAPVMIWMTDEMGRYTYLNQSAQNFVKNATGRDTWEAGISLEDKGVRKALIEEARAKQRPFRLEYRFCQKNGTCIWVSEAAVPYITSSGKLVGYLGVVTDIDAQKKIQIETKAFTKEVEEMNHLLMAREEKMLEMKKELAQLRSKLA